MGLYLYDGKLLVRGGALATSQSCCCTATEACCGIPSNCVLSLSVDAQTFVYNHANGLWEDENNQAVMWPVSFGNCQDSVEGTSDPKYATCCLWTSASDTPFLGDCSQWVRATYVRIKCSTCCDTIPPTAIGCSLQDQVDYTSVNGVVIAPGTATPCDAAMPTFAFTMTCAGDSCNEFP